MDEKKAHFLQTIVHLLQVLLKLPAWFSYHTKYTIRFTLNLGLTRVIVRDLKAEKNAHIINHFITETARKKYCVLGNLAPERFKSLLKKNKGLQG